MNPSDTSAVVRVVSGAWLEEHLDDPTVHVVEVSSQTENTVYNQGHVPGAAWRYWKNWCWHETDREFVSPEVAAKNLGALGIQAHDTLVLYGDPVQYGPYAAWTYVMAGHPDVRILDGSRTKWLNEGRPLSTDVPAVEPVDYGVCEVVPSVRIGRDEVRAGLARADRIILDARSPEEYAGQRVMPPPDFDHGAERKGRIPGARHLHYRELLNDDDTYKTPDELAGLFAGVGIVPGQEADVVVYCRLSHRATLTWIALTHLLGIDNVRVYDGSWTEWGSIVGFPIEK